MVTKVGALQGLPLEAKRALTDAAKEIAAAKTAVLKSGTLAIKTGASPLAKTTNASILSFAHQVRKSDPPLLLSLSAGDMAALSGTVVNATFNVYAFFVTRAGVKSTVMGTAGATLSAVIQPRVPEDSVQLGFVIINPTGTGNFVGGTTALDDGTVAPNAVYVDTLGGYNSNPYLVEK